MQNLQQKIVIAVQLKSINRSVRTNDRHGVCYEFFVVVFFAFEVVVFLAFEEG